VFKILFFIIWFYFDLFLFFSFFVIFILLVFWVYWRILCNKLIPIFNCNSVLSSKLRRLLLLRLFHFFKCKAILKIGISDDCQRLIFNLVTILFVFRRFIFYYSPFNSKQIVISQNWNSIVVWMNKANFR